MRVAHLIFLGALAFSLAGATCVSNIERRSPEGPWIGEVVNNSDQTVHSVVASARIVDAYGRELSPGGTTAYACPSKLLPGEVGAFELFAPVIPGDPHHAAPTPPFTADFTRVAASPIGVGEARGDGLLVEELSRDTAARRVELRLTNNGPGPYVDYTVCGIVRDRYGRVDAVGRADGPPARAQLAVGESVNLTISFDSMPRGPIDIRYHALGLLDAPYTDCCPRGGASTWHSVDLGAFRVLLPADWTYEGELGIDRVVGRFIGPGVTLIVQFDGHADPLMNDDDPDYDVHVETISARTAKFAFPAGTGIVGLHMVGVDGDEFHRRELGIAGLDLTTEQKEIARQIFRSIRICECAEP